MKIVEWVGSAKRDLLELPDKVQEIVGFALFQAQCGVLSPRAKPLKGFGGASVQEIVADYKKDTYRAVYTVAFAERIYVLHVFQKKSTSGIATAKNDMDIIARRLKQVLEQEKGKI